MNDAEKLQELIDKLGKCADSIRKAFEESEGTMPPSLSFVTSDGRYEISVKRRRIQKAGSKQAA